MTSEWKIKQEIYHRLNTEHTDDLNKVDIVITENVKEDALRHFFEYVDEWIYPAKSYAVAFCYAYWISQDYPNEDFYSLLNDPDLLHGALARTELHGSLPSFDQHARRDGIAREAML